MESGQKLQRDYIRNPVPDEQWEGTSYENVTWKICNGDSKKILSDLPNDTFDCVVTSPPYFWLRDYGVDNQIGQEKTVQEYVEVISSVMDEVYRTLKPTGLLFLNLSDTYYSGKGQPKKDDAKSSKRRFGLRAVDKSGGLDIGMQRKSMIGIPWRVAIEMMKRKWTLRSTIIWHREKALPEKVTDRPKRSYEHVFMFAKDRYYFFNPQPLQERRFDEDVWTIPARPKSSGLDTAPFPDELVRRCLDIGCRDGGMVLDPFAGSGTTLRVAVESRRSAVGIDLNKEFCEYMAKQMGTLTIQ